MCGPWDLFKNLFKRYWKWLVFRDDIIFCCLLNWYFGSFCSFLNHYVFLHARKLLYIIIIIEGVKLFSGLRISFLLYRFNLLIIKCFATKWFPNLLLIFISDLKLSWLSMVRTCYWFFLISMGSLSLVRLNWKLWSIIGAHLFLLSHFIKFFKICVWL